MNKIELNIPETIRLAIMDVHLLDVEQILTNGAAILSDERIAACKKFLFLADRQRSLGASLLLDSLLREYGYKEKEMIYHYSITGKPYFSGYPSLHFNLSHAGNYALCALSEHYELGIDIEKIIPFDKDVAKFCMDEEELSDVQSLTASEKDAAFIAYWSMKEAVLKVTGSGLDEHLFPKIDRTDHNYCLNDSRYKDITALSFELPNYRGAIAWRKPL